MKRLLILVIILGSFQTTVAQFNKVGRTSIQFLKVGTGARQTAMGEACIADLHDVNAVYWNPAALTRVKNFQSAFHYNKWIVDLNIISAAAGFNLGNFGVVALSYNFMNYGDLEEATVTSPTGGVDTRTGNIFSGRDAVFGIAYAKSFTDKLSLGINVKYIREDLYKYNASIWSFDVGSLYNTGWKGIRLAMAAQNFSSQARWLHTGEKNQQSYEMPLLYRIGASMDLLGGEDLLLGGNPNSQKLTFNVDAIHSNDYSERVNIGMEYVFLNQFYFRGGYRINVDEGALSFGIGINTKITGMNMQIDYSYVSFDFLDSPHRISMLLSL